MTLFALPSPCPGEVVTARVRWVIDGDTVVMEGGEKVRYIGIDTPERGEPFFREAKERNAALVLGKEVRLVLCEGEQRDKYSRLLAFVYADGVFVNRALVEDGLARRLIIPPCGLPVAGEFKRLERSAKRRGLGLWARPRGVTPALRP